MSTNGAELYEKIKHLAKLVQIFDDFTMLRKTNPEKVEQIVKDINDYAVSKVWSKYKKVINHLAYYPIKMPNVRRLINLKGIFRIFLLSTLIYYILLLGCILHPKVFPTILSDAKVFFTALSISLASGFSLIFLEFRIRHLVILYESENREFLQPQLDMLIKGVNELLKVLTSYVRMYNKITGYKKDFIIELWRGDYKRLKILKVKKLKRFFPPESSNVYVYKIS